MEENRVNFIEKVAASDPEYLRVLNSIVERKKENKDESRRKKIAEITKEILTSEAVVLDNGCSVTYQDLMIGRAIANNVGNSELGFRDLGDMQRVLGESAEQETGVIINVITNGQDLGD